MNPIAQSWHWLGVLACQRGDLRGGIDLFRKAVEAQVDFVAAWMDLGAAFRELSDAQSAFACFDRVVAIDPAHADAYNSRGEALSAQRRHAEALASYEIAIKLNRGDARAHSNAGAALLELGRYDPSIERFDQALAIHPGYVRAMSNRGSALYNLGRFQEALAQFDQALAIRPDDAETRLNRGLTRLLLGNFRDGWADYEARTRTANSQERRSFARPQWHGDAELRGRTVLLHAEQGLGDTLQFCRYVPLVADRGASVVLEAPRELVSLLRTIDRAGRVVAAGDPLPPFELHCPLLSLPLAFATDLSNIPSRAAAYLRADHERARAWREHLGTPGRALRVGLAWSGGRLLKNDRNRSLPLRGLLEALQGIDAELVSLQKDVRDTDRDALAGSDVRNFTDELADFADTAALVSALDLVISVDTSVAHLAGALGKPTWILLPWVPDWRWLLEREDSPWYPTVRLWRQRSPGDWGGVLGDLRAQLAERSPRRVIEMQ